MLHRVFGRNDAQQREQVGDYLRHRTVGRRGTRIGHGLHHLLADGLVAVGQVDAVPFRLTHLARTVEPRNLHEPLAAEDVGLAFGKIFHAVDLVETAGEAAGQFEVLLLILAHRHARGAVLQDVGGHQHRIAQQADIDVFGLLADLVLERGRAFELPDEGVHAEQQRQFGHFGHVALDIDRRHVGIEPCGEVFGQHVGDVPVQDGRVGMGRERVVVGYEEEAAVGMLHFDEVFQCTEIITQMQVSGRSYSAQYSFHIAILKFERQTYEIYRTKGLRAPKYNCR